MLKMWKNLSRKDKFAFTLNAILLIGIGQALRIILVTPIPVMEMPAQPQQIEAVAVDPAMEKMLKSGECWTEGEGHPFPTRVVYNGEMRGTQMVDRVLKHLFEDADNGINPNLVNAFCK